MPLNFHGMFQLSQASACSSAAHLLSFNTTRGCLQTYQFYFYTSNNQIIALGHLDVDEIESISNELIAANQELNNLTRQITASFGVSRLMPDEGSESVLKRADRALLQAKTLGRNRTVMNETQTLYRPDT